MSRLRALFAFIATRRLRAFVLALAVLLPVFAAPTIELPGATYATLFVIDISESMNVRDADRTRPDESRLDAAKAATIAALAKLPCGSRASLALFAGTDVLTLFEPLEICRHFPAIEKVVAGIDWRMAWDGDSRVEVALVNALREANRRGLDLVFVTDGDEAPHVEAPHLSDLLSMQGRAHGWLIGVGGSQPSPVPRLDAGNRIVGYWSALDAAREGFHPNLVEKIEQSGGRLDGDAELEGVEEHKSVLRADYLGQLAAAAGIGYATLRSPSTLAEAATDTSLRRRQKAERDIRALFGLAAALLVALGGFERARAARARESANAPRVAAVPASRPS